MTDAEWLEFQKLAAQMARACEIIAAADKLAEAAEMKLRTGHGLVAMKKALDAFKVVRNGN